MPIGSVCVGPLHLLVKVDDQRVVAGIEDVGDKEGDDLLHLDQHLGLTGYLMERPVGVEEVEGGVHHLRSAIGVLAKEAGGVGVRGEIPAEDLLVPYRVGKMFLGESVELPRSFKRPFITSEAPVGGEGKDSVGEAKAALGRILDHAIVGEGPVESAVLFIKAVGKEKAEGVVRVGSQLLILVGHRCLAEEIDDPTGLYNALGRLLEAGQIKIDPAKIATVDLILEAFPEGDDDCLEVVARLCRICTVHSLTAPLAMPL